VELLSADYERISEGTVDSLIRAMKDRIRQEGFKTFEHPSASSYTSELPKVGLRISFSGKTPEGTPLDLDSIHSKVILLDFWYSGCGYCRYAMPFLRSMQQKYGPSGFTIVGVDPSDNEPPIVQEVIRTESLKNPEMMVDPKVTDSLGVQVYPTFLFLDSKHKVLSSSFGYEKANEPAMEKQIEDDLAKEH
jgi:thiol-disulfide isomerase/thioredoxin